jgi:hypothetical protein
MGVKMKRFSFLITILAILLISSSCDKPDAVNGPVSKPLVSIDLQPQGDGNIIVTDKDGNPIDLGILDKTLKNKKTISESIQDIVDKSKNHRQFEARLLDLLLKLVFKGELTWKEADAIWDALKNADIP